MKYFLPHRSGIAMIELIFAIVIIGITLMSAPMLISTASKSGYVAMQQEGIGEAASRVNLILGKAWDENRSNQNSPATTILNTNGHVDLNGTVRRKGTPKYATRSFMEGNNTYDATSVANLGPDAADRDDTDDYRNDNIGVRLEGMGTGADYIETTTVSLTTNVSYIADAPNGGTYNNPTLVFDPVFAATANTTNIKGITVTLESSSGVDELNKTIVLRAFNCNIGWVNAKNREDLTQGSI